MVHTSRGFRSSRPSWSWRLGRYQSRSWAKVYAVRVPPSITNQVGVKPCPASRRTAVSGWRCSCEDGENLWSFTRLQICNRCCPLHLRHSSDAKGLKLGLEECPVMFRKWSLKAQTQRSTNGSLWEYRRNELNLKNTKCNKAVRALLSLSLFLEGTWAYGSPEFPRCQRTDSTHFNKNISHGQSRQLAPECWLIGSYCENLSSLRSSILQHMRRPHVFAVNA